MKHNRLVITFVMLICFALVYIVFPNDTYAMSEDEIYKALLMNGMSRCYSSDILKRSVDVQSYNSFGQSVLLTGKGEPRLYIPTGIGTGNKIKEQKEGGTQIGCYELFLGDKTGSSFGGTMSGVFTVFGKNEPKANSNNLENNLASLGYTKEVKSDSKKLCINVQYNQSTDYQGGNNAYNLAGSMCWNENDFTNGTISEVDQLAGNERIENGSKVTFFGAPNNGQYDIVANADGYQCRIAGVLRNPIGPNAVGELKGLNNKQCIIFDDNRGTSLYNVILNVTSEDGENNVAALEIEGYNDAYKRAVNYFSGGEGLTAFGTKEKAELYSLYFNKIYELAKVNGTECKKTKAEVGDTPIVKTDNGIEYYTYTTNNAWCRVQIPDENMEKTVSVFGDDDYQLRGSCNFECLLKKMFELDLDGVDLSQTGVALNADPTDEQENPDAAKKTCKNSGGAKALGWVICPILEWVSDAVDGVYNEYVEPNLQLSPQLFANQDGTSGTREAWETFRNFANIAFIILLLVVIFSQLTGVGIDNYGIKKILPKLIVAAILINLSYLICMVLVDLSNIVGSGIRSLFSSLGAGVDGMSFGIDGGSTAGDSNFTLESTAITGVGILAAIGTVGAIFANPAILLSLLVSAIGVFISIFFLFILLAAREAAIIVLVILSPLAFVCYMLPNTKKLFDKWWKFFEGLLLVYPIIGLLVGGGDYVSRLLMNTGFADPAQGGSFITAFTAMIVGIIPIFFIPMVLKGSFAAMGKVGGMLTGLGARARGAATGAMRRTEGFQNAQKVGLERRGRLAAQRRAGGRIGEDGQFHERGLRGRFARTGLGRALGVDVQMGRARNEYVKGQIDRNSALDSLNPEIANYQLQQAQNARTQSAAEARAGAMPLTPELAQQRATSRRSAQELKAFQDQFAGYSQAQLREEANNAGAWLGQENGSQRMSALLQSMEANGMENDMARMLSNNDISNRSEVLQTLASSKNAVFSAYGKRANRPATNADGSPVLDANGNQEYSRVSFSDFMTGTGNAAGTNQNMQTYLAEKGDDAIAKLDDKSLGMIANAQNTLTNSGSTEQIMSTNQLVEAASRINSEDSLEHVNNMLANRNDIRMSGEQLSNMNATTLTSLYGNASAERAIIQASDAIRNDAKLLNTVKAPSMTVINRIRMNNGHQGI